MTTIIIVRGPEDKRGTHKGMSPESIARRLFGRSAEVQYSPDRNNPYDMIVRPVRGTSSADVLAEFTTHQETPIRFRTGWNDPGYEPEFTPEGHKTWAQARGRLVRILSRRAQEESSIRDDLDHLIAVLRCAAGPEWSAQAADGYVYWIRRNQKQEEHA